MFDRKIFFDSVRHSPFDGSLTQSQVSGMDAILTAFERDYRWDDLRWLAYCFATTYHETACTMQPIKEYGSASYLQGKPYYPYYGRGYVQLTWEDNYRKMGSKIGADLLGDNRERALEPDIAAEVMFSGMRDGDFTGKSLDDYFNDATDDPVDARRIINGTDKASIIAGYHHEFLASLQKSRAPDVAPQPQAPAVDETIWIRRSEVAGMLRKMADDVERG